MDETRDVAPLAGKTVAVVHAAWHSCGSYQVNVSQMRAYRSLGARVISIAMMDDLCRAYPAGKWAGYAQASVDLPADQRHHVGAPLSKWLTTRLFSQGWLRLIHGDQASWLVELAKAAPLPEALAAEKIDLVHANHYFTLPLVERLLAGRAAPVLLETQDIQAKQYALRNRGGFFLPPYASYDDMLAIELSWMARAATVNLHLNEEEHRDFSRLLPQARHALIYPAVAPVAIGAGGGDEMILVSSDNYGNYVSLKWFLTQVMPLAEGVAVSIYGNIAEGMRRRDKALFERWRGLFRGRVEDIGAVYADARCVLLPTTEGHGLSIKAVEALSSGAPLIATPQAFRGMGVDPASLANVGLANDAEGFAALMRAGGPPKGASLAPREASPTRRFYDETFSEAAYRRALWALAGPLLGEEGAGPSAPVRAEQRAEEKDAPPAGQARRAFL